MFTLHSISTVRVVIQMERFILTPIDMESIHDTHVHIHHFYARLSAQKLHMSILQQSIELDPSCCLCYHHIVQTNDKVNVSCKQSVGVPHPAHDTVDYLTGFGCNAGDLCPQK